MSEQIYQPTNPTLATGAAKQYHTPWLQRAGTRKFLHALLVYALVLPGALLFIIPLLWMLYVSSAVDSQPGYVGEFSARME
jgi:ABC-type glycerol-3-phosphate transport system permease component